MLRFLRLALMLTAGPMLAQVGMPSASTLAGRVEGKVYIAAGGAYRITIPVLPELGGAINDTPTVVSFKDHFNVHVSMAAFPMDDPRYAILVMVDEPKGNKKSHGYATGGWVSAPAVGSIVERMAPLMGISPMPVVAPEDENPLVALVPDYDSPASKKSHSLVMQVKATGDAESKSAATESVPSGAPLEAE